jgi:PAS domain S-box-containing protein
MFLRRGKLMNEQKERGVSAAQNSFRTAEVFVRDDLKLHTVPVTGLGRPDIPEEMRARWQSSLSLFTKVLGICSGTIMRVRDNGVEVFLRSGEPLPAYTAGAFFPFNTRSYCENAIGLNRFVIMDISEEQHAPGSPVCYCGIPLRWEDGSFFGTLCLFSLDCQFKEDDVHPLLSELASSIEKDLELLYRRQGWSEENDRYAKAMEAVLQYSPGGIFSYSAEEDEQFSYISDNMLAFLGYTLDEFVRKFDNRFSLMVYSEDRERTLREIDEQIRVGPFDRCEYRIEKSDGTLAWVHDEGHIVADADGKRWFYVVIVDITETVAASEREREKFRSSIQTLLAANPDAIGTLQLNITRNTCGEGHGISADIRKIISADTADEFFAGVAGRMTQPQMRDEFTALFNRPALLESFNSGRSGLSFEYVRQNDAGAPIWVRMYLNMLTNPDTGDVEGVAYSVDISADKRRDEILKIITSQEYDLIALLRPDQDTVEAYFLGETLPRAFRGLLPAPGAKYSLREFRRNALEKWLHPDDREKYLRYSDPAYYLPIMDKGRNYEFVLRERFPDAPGGEMYRKFQHYYLENDRSTILVIESDVTTIYKKQQQELDEAKAEARRVVDIMNSIAIGISVLHMPDPDHLSISYVNQQMFRMLGFEYNDGGEGDLQSSPNKLVRDYLADAFIGVHPDDLERVRKGFHDNFGSEYFSLDKYRTIGADGKYRWIRQEVRLREVTPEYRVFYSTYHDVGEEVRLNEELKAQLEAEKQLRQEATVSNAAKTDFLSRMSHDIRTPLNGIIGMTYIAREQDNPPRTADCLSKIDTSSKFLLGLINDVLDMSRVESNRIELNLEPYPIDEFKEYLDAVIRPLCLEKGQRFIFDENAALSGLVPLADKLRTNQIIFNLLSNAVKYTPEGGTITYRVSGHVLESGRVGIDHEISDTGIGMSREFQKILFEPFSQEGRDDNSDKRGTGLGLAIVKKLVDLMGGTISVKSDVGMGTSFILHLEFDAVPAYQVVRSDPAKAVDGGVADSGLAGRHVLLCEDHPLNQEIIRTLLEQDGIIVEIAGNGKQGLERFAASPIRYYDAVLMDIRMPVMDGYEATREIRSLPRADSAAVPIIAMTADAFDDDVKRCLDSGMSGHLSKPIDPQLLHSRLKEIFKR